MPDSFRRAKIVATLGPASRSEAVLRRLLRAGMDVARLNFSHGTHDEHRAVHGVLRRLAEREDRALAILADLQGPKLRVGVVPDAPLLLRTGAPFTLTTRRGVAESGAISVSYTKLPSEVRRGDHILLDDGLLHLRVMRTTATEVHTRVVTGGPLTSNKGINIPGRSLSVPALTAKDRRDLEFALDLGVDYVALSFVRDPKDLRSVRRILARRESPAKLIAKLEKPQAVENLIAILKAADGIMVARGDLGVEMPAEQVPLLQKRMIREARDAGKPVITATQMLESMITQSRPTRAEASDVANAVLDGTDAVMLSGETAVGSHPVEAVAVMDRILRTTERSSAYREAIIDRRYRTTDHMDTAEDAVAGSAARSALRVGAKLIAVFTSSGSTALRVSRHRPAVAVVACTPDENIFRQLALLWGVTSLLTQPLPSTDAMISELNRTLRAARFVKKGDLVVITAGTPVGRRGTTNFMKIHRVE